MRETNLHIRFFLIYSRYAEFEYPISLHLHAIRIKIKKKDNTK